MRCVGEGDRDRDRDRLWCREAACAIEGLERLEEGFRDPVGRPRDCVDKRPPSGLGVPIIGSEVLLPLTNSLIAGNAGE